MPENKYRTRARRVVRRYQSHKKEYSITTEERTVMNDSGDIISQEETLIPLQKGRVPADESDVGLCWICDEFAPRVTLCEVCHKPVCAECERVEESMRICELCVPRLRYNRKKAMRRLALLDVFIEQVG